MRRSLLIVCIALLVPGAAQAEVLRAGGEGRLLRTGPAAAVVNDVVAHPDGSFATLGAAGGTGAPLQPIVTLFGPEGGVRGVASPLFDHDPEFGPPPLRRDGDLAPTPDGGLVALAAGHALIRLDASGRPVRAFGDGGTLRAADGHWVRVFALPDGRIVLAGDSNHRLALRMLHPDGRLDEAYGTGGTAFAPRTSGADLVALDAAIDAAGRVSVLDGNVVVRFASDGRPDFGFARAGELALAPYGITATTLDTAGNDLVLTGSTCADGVCRPALARVDETGATVAQQSVSLSDSFVVESRGAIVDVRPGTARRLLPDGQEDAGFGIGVPAIPGRVVAGSGHVAAFHEGGYVAAHAVEIDGTTSGTLISRLDASGGLVPGFGRSFGSIRASRRLDRRRRLAVRVTCTVACSARISAGTGKPAVRRVPAGRSRTLRLPTARRGRSVTVHALLVDRAAGEAIVLDERVDSR